MHLNSLRGVASAGVLLAICALVQAFGAPPDGRVALSGAGLSCHEVIVGERYWLGVFHPEPSAVTDSEKGAPSEVRVSAIAMPPGPDYELHVLGIRSGESLARRQVTVHGKGDAVFLLPWRDEALLVILRPRAVDAIDPPLAEEASTPVHFEKHVLTHEYYSDGVAVGDVDRDGHRDIVSGPYWYAGPDFKERFAFFPPQRLVPERSPSNSMFSFLHDFDADGWLDVLVLGRVHLHPAAWYRNPGDDTLRRDRVWRRHFVFDRIRGESPVLTDIDGDDRVELLCHWEGAWGWIEPSPSSPDAPWRFHAIATATDPPQFYHGEGVGDLNGDGRRDIVINDGWYEQPAEIDSEWPFHPHRFSPGRGGAQMFVDDVDGDGDRDVITALDAHGYGIAWFAQQPDDSTENFVEHPILGDRESLSPGEITFSQPHALAYADIDGDGLDDLIAGKRVWAHGPTGDVEPAAPPVVYWFRRTSGGEGVRFQPELVDDRSGVGTQIQATDVDGDGRNDIVTASKLGTFLFLNRSQ